MLANRLVSGLASENVRWAEAVENYQRQGETLAGDVLLAAAFISYVGYFTKSYRLELMQKHWVPYLTNIMPPIPFTEGLDPLTLLTDDAQIAQWNNEGLPGDRMSTENATILMNTQRWPLIIDPQLQGIKWIKVYTHVAGIACERVKANRRKPLVILLYFDSHNIEAQNH